MRKIVNEMEINFEDVMIAKFYIIDKNFNFLFIYFQYKGRILIYLENLILIL